MQACMQMVNNVVLFTTLYYWLSQLLLSNASSKFDQQHNVYKKPVIRIPPLDVFSADGVLEFSCQAEGVPKPVINWHDATTGQQVIDRTPTEGSTSGIHVNQHYGRLMISNPIRDTIYSFYCNASNVAGWAISDPPVKGGLAYLESGFRQDPTDKTVHEGSRVLLECRPPKGVPTPQVYWSRQDEPLSVSVYHLQGNSTNNQKEKPRISVTKHGSLQIDSVTVADTATYVCIARNIAKQVRSKFARLTVEPRVRFIETPNDMRVRQGADVKFKCLTEGKQLVQWSKDHGKGLIDPTRAELTDGYLLLKNVQLSDAGIYVCTAPGSIAADAVLTVETPPTFLRTPDDLTVHEGDLAIFHCITTGYPKPSIYWELADKTPIFPSDQSELINSHKRFFLHNDGHLEIRDVQMKEAGRYQCTAHSSVDRIHSSAMLRVLPALSNVSNRPKSWLTSENTEAYSDDNSVQRYFPIAPVISLTPANQTKSVGELAILDCELHIGRPDLPENLPDSSIFVLHDSISTDGIVEWQRTTVATGDIPKTFDFSSHTEEQRFSLLPGGSLQILDLQTTDTGSYTCTAKSPFRLTNPSYQSQLSLQSNWTAYLNVFPRGNPIVRDSANEYPVSPPRNVRVLNRTDTTITLAWDASSWADGETRDAETHRQIVYWVEFYRPDRPHEGWQIVERNWHASVVKVGNLQPDTVYYFLIRPRFYLGRVGWASAPLGPILTLPPIHLSRLLQSENYQDRKINQELIQLVKHVEINDLHLHTLTPERLRVTWTVREKPNILRLLDGYTIYYRKVTMLQCVTVSAVEEPTGISAISYMADDYCSLQAGSSSSVSDLYIRLQELQTLRAKLVSKNPVGLPIRSVDVKGHYSMAELTDTSQPVLYESSGLIRDLQPFNCYEVSVKAHISRTLFGKVEGRESVPRTVLTFESFPSAPPEQIAVRWLAHHHIEISWVAPPASEWNGLLTGFTIYVYDELARQHEIFNVSSSDRKTHIKGLTAPEAYFLQMAGVTCKGVGIRSPPLRLDPKLKRLGSGIGWGYDEITGLPVLPIEEGSVRDEVQKQLTGQPWFIGIVVSSSLLWCALIMFVVYCCHRHCHTVRKQVKSLIANTSSCASDNGELHESHTTGCTKSTRQAGRRTNDKNLSPLEPLINPSVDSAESGLIMPHLPRISCNHLNAIEEQHAYGLYSVTMDNFQWPVQSGDGRPDRTALYQDLNPTNDNVTGTHTKSEMNTRLSPINTEKLHVTRNVQNGAMQPTHTMFNYTSTCSPMLSNYMTYQPQVVPLSQSITEFTNLGDRQLSFYVPNANGISLGVNGLPMVAPVARLGNPYPHIERNNSSSNIENLDSTSSVAPYATASIIPNRVNTKYIIRSMRDNETEEGNLSVNRIGISVLGASEMNTHSGQGSYSSSDGSNSCTSARLHTNEKPSTLRDGRKKAWQINVHNEFPVSMAHINGSNIPVEMSARSSTPMRAHDFQLISLHPGKSDSSASSKTRNSEENNHHRQNVMFEPVVPVISRSGQSSAYVVPGDYKESIDGSLYSFIDEAIPPPPASPPPPAPRTHNGHSALTERIHDSDSRKTNCRSTPRSVSDISKCENMQTHILPIYDTNAETSEEEWQSNQVLNFNNISSNIPFCEDDQATFCVQLAPDESKNPTYAQVC